MTAVLGIDAAWTATEPSGVALIRTNPGNGRWEYVAIAPSYNAFIATANRNPVQWDMRPESSAPDPECLLTAASRLLGGDRVSVVSVDMPMSRTAITGRRTADNEISIHFGARGCSTHSPNRDRPGAISTTLLSGLSECGYGLAVDYTDDRTNSIIEVYPHPALLTLVNRNYRVPYKVKRRRGKKEPKLSVPEKANRLIKKFRSIHAGLSCVIDGIPDFLPDCPYSGTLTFLKRYEDALDALVCAWVGARYLEGCATAYGDGNAAIWIP